MTLRACFIGVVSAAVLSVVGFYAELLTPLPLPRLAFNSGVPPSAPFSLLLLLAGLGSLGGVARLINLTRQEILSAYVIVLVSAPVTSYGVLGYMLPHAAYTQYAAIVSPGGSAFDLSLFPSWFSPDDPAVVRPLFEGGAAIQWSPWLVPLAAWCSFLIALIAASGCICLLMQRQWISHERLTFPLAQIPLEVVAESGTQAGLRGHLPARGLFWTGFAVAFGLWLAADVHTVLPAVPAIDLGPAPLMMQQLTGPLAALGTLNAVFWPWLLAIAYLIPTDLSFSCWFFWVLRVVTAAVAITLGAEPMEAEAMRGPAWPAFGFLGFGGVVALSLLVGWRARRHLGRALRVAFSHNSGRADSDEPLPYRWTLIALAVSVGWLVWFCCLAGARVWFGIGLVTLTLMYYGLWTHLRAETGLGLLFFPAFLSDQLLVAIGERTVMARELILMRELRWSHFPGSGATAHVIAGSMLEGVKIADSAHIRPRPLIYGMAIGILVALATGVYVTMSGLYRYGFYGLGATENTWLGSQVFVGHEGIVRGLEAPSSPSAEGLIAALAGAGVTVTLALMRARFWWWPLHPVGFVAANSWGMHFYYMPFAIGWLARTLVTRYGGLRLYRRTVPLAGGLLSGDLAEQVAWTALRLTLLAGRG